jgi:poly-gamma-glutamate synthesis protein (capsule biosynthesis protein)
MSIPSHQTALSSSPPSGNSPITLFLSGDVMIGRGIDQILPHPSDPILFEPYMDDARGYVELAERRNGAIPRAVDPSYIWGDALQVWEKMPPEVRVINLETSITTSNDYWSGKMIHYRMHPANLPVLQTAKIDACVLANNHVLDWGYPGLLETLESLKQAGIQPIGAGQNRAEAESPAVVEVPGKGRVIVFAFGTESSGIPRDWGATADVPGVNLLPDLSDATVEYIRTLVERVKQPGDIVVASIHWGSNWGYQIPPEHIIFAQSLIERANVDVIHGHSSHHVRALQVYHGKLILYGAGDLINDYEGIEGFEELRPDLALLYLVNADPLTGRLVELRMVPMQIKHFKLNFASYADALWLKNLLNREGKPFGARVEMTSDQSLILEWQ